jgi:hypothetical protein
MKVLILVVSADIEPYISLTKAIKETWASYSLPEIDIYFYYGKTDKIITDERDIFFDIHESLHNMGYKILEMFEYIKDIDYDYIFKTNSSSYVNQEKLLEFLKDKPKNNFCCGMVGIYEDRSKFVSGSGIFLSKDIVELVLKNKNNWNHYIIEDVALSKLLNSL